MDTESIYRVGWMDDWLVDLTVGWLVSRLVGWVGGRVCLSEAVSYLWRG